MSIQWWKHFPLSTMNDLFITQSSDCYYVVNVDLDGAAFPLVRAGSIEAASRFMDQAEHWLSWNWLLSADRSSAWRELRRNAKDHCSHNIVDLGPVTWDDMSIRTFDPPSDATDLQDLGRVNLLWT